MSNATHAAFAKDSWQTPRNVRTFRAYMALHNQEIASRLRELRGSKPQTLVADELGVSERGYQLWEAGEAKPSYRNLQKLAEYFDVTETYILKGEDIGATVAAAAAPALTGIVGGLDQLERIERRQQETLDRLDAVLVALLTPEVEQALSKRLQPEDLARLFPEVLRRARGDHAPSDETPRDTDGLDLGTG